MDSKNYQTVASSSKHSQADSNPQSSTDYDSVETDGRRTKGSRRVAKLTPEQLLRKRAHDREAQRNSRKRTTEQIAALNDALDESRGDNQKISRRNEELEERIKLLERRMAETKLPPATEEIPSNWDKGDIISFLNEPADASFVEATPSWGTPIEELSWTGPVGLSSLSLIPDFSASSNNRLLDSTGAHRGDEAYTYTNLPPSTFPTSGAHYPTPDQLLRPRSIPGFMFGQPPTSYHDLPFPSPASNAPDFISTCWQKQPSVYAWQISTKILPPDNPTDREILPVLHYLRHSAITDSLDGEQLIGPPTPSLNAIVGWPDEPHMHPLATAVNQAIIVLEKIVHTIPHRVAGLYAPYRLYQWFVSPTKETYNNLYEWQTPRPSQLLTSHPMWMDLPPWGKFRDRIIENQHLYSNNEFQFAFMAHMRLKWPYDPRAALAIEDGKVVVSPLMVNHLKRLDVMCLTKEFRTMFPEFIGLCTWEDD